MLASIIAHEPYGEGWRGLTEDGEVLQVAGASAPTDIVAVMCGSAAVGHRAVVAERISIAQYLCCIDRGLVAFAANELESALAEFDAAVALAPTLHARFNRSLTLLGLGRWAEGFDEFEKTRFLNMPPLYEQAIKHGLQQWHGQDIRGGTLLLVHDAGFGDTIQMLRYVPTLFDMGINVKLLVPPVLERLAEQTAPVGHFDDADFFCPMLSLLYLLGHDGPTAPYLIPDATLRRRWRGCLGESNRERVGVAWSVGRKVEGDFPRVMPLDMLYSALGDADVYSIQQQGADEAQALGIQTVAFEDFADCAAFISLMDRIVTIDTAAAHVAGAIGHPNVTLLLSHSASWRWRLNPYPQFTICRQSAPGDWGSALAEI